MTLIDIVVLVIVGLSMLFGIIRGLMREVLALASWIAAFLAANAFAPEAARWLPAGMAAELRLLAGFVVIFLLVLVVMSLLAILASKLVKSAGLGAEDRLLGAVFGLLRGGLIVTTLVLLAGLTALPRQPVWRNALLTGPMVVVAGYVKSWLPGDLSERIRFG
jgi:membrane protein required for colicin V production